MARAIEVELSPAENALGDIETLIEHDETTAGHTHRHRGIGDRSSVGFDAGAVLYGGASV